jgi:hypothetical protein
MPPIAPHSSSSSNIIKGLVHYASSGLRNSGLGFTPLKKDKKSDQLMVSASGNGDDVMVVEPGCCCWCNKDNRGKAHQHQNKPTQSKNETNSLTTLSVDSKLLIYKAVLKPIWTYGFQLWEQLQIPTTKSSST